MKETRKRRWARKVLGFRNALVDCFRLPRRILLAVFGLTTLHWLLRFSVLYLTLRGLGSELAGPGPSSCNCSRSPPARSACCPGAGSAELASAALLTPMVGKSTTAAAILIWRFVTYYFYLIVGAPVFLQLAGRPLLRRLMPSRHA